MPRRSTSPTRINLEAGYWLDCRETLSQCWHIYWREPDGRRRKESTGQKARAQAEDYFRTVFLPDRQRELAVKTAAADDPLWATLLDLYEADRRRAGAHPSTFVILLKLRRATAGLHVSETSGLFWEQCKEARRQGHYSLFRGNQRNPGKVCLASESTLGRELRGLMAAARWGIRRALVNPALMPQIALPENTKSHAASAMTPAQIDQMLAYAATCPPEGQGKMSRVALFAALALCTGGRARAIECLKWEQVDFQKKEIDLQSPGKPMTKKRNAIVPILDDLLPFLERAKREAGVSPYVLRHSGVTIHSWNEFCLAAVGQRFRRHDMRHSLATKLVNRGVPLGVVADWLGNTQAMIERVYSHHSKVDNAKRALAFL